MLSLEDLTTLALFAAVVELRSFTAAAKASGMGKATVSRRIAALERRLCVRLLRRTTRNIVPTEEGKRLYERSARMIVAAREATDMLADAAARPAGVLRVAAPIVFSHRHLTVAVVEFLEQHKDIQIQLLPRAAPVDLIADEIDVAIRIGKFDDSAFAIRRLAMDRVVVVGAHDYFKRHGTPRTLADLEKHVSLRLSWEAEHPRWRFRGAQRASSLRLTGNLVASDATVVREAAMRGLGVAMLPSHIVAEEVRTGSLVRVLKSIDLPELPISVVYPDRGNLPLRVRAFVDFLVARFAHAEWRKAALL